MANRCIDCGAVVEGRNKRCPECKALLKKARNSSPANRESRRLAYRLRAAIPWARACKYCGQEFVTAGDAKVCPECAAKNHTRTGNNKRVCLCCGAEVKSKSLYCPACNAAHGKEFERQRSAARRQEARETVTPRRCMYCGEMFMGVGASVVCPECKVKKSEQRAAPKPKLPNNIAANMEAAKAAGMKYGEYMTLKTLGRL